MAAPEGLLLLWRRTCLSPVALEAEVEEAAEEEEHPLMLAYLLFRRQERILNMTASSSASAGTAVAKAASV